MSEKKVTIITVACLAFILLAGGAAYYYLDMTVLPEKQEELKKLNLAVEADTKKKKAIPNLKIQISDLEKQEAELITHIPNLTREEYDRLADLMDELRRRSGVEVPRAAWVVPQKPQQMAGRPSRAWPPTVHKVQYDVAVEGSFYQLLRYINLLEQQTRFINVESFTVSRGSTATEAAGRAGAKRDLKITIYSYTYKQPEEVVLELEEVKYGKSTEPPD